MIHFELLIEYDFDDSVIPEPRKETPVGSSILTMEDPLTFYIDDDFKKDSDYIYALCCIDAHDMTSNYSMQQRITFNKMSNKLVTMLISPQGASKPYPNFYLKAGLTVDSIKDSGHYSAQLFFDPEYLSVTDRAGSDVGLFTTENQNGHYKMQLINVDRQKSKILTIKIDDLRT